ncbi:MAG: cytochrome d ubiquinol oxidase subunit II [Candidatus Cloacimonadota bacterium]|nr:MAG: cytochrome d ubiquinol oxidase subunit II [Candidatus Cloacimonadota bacterium]PIE80530.1 MAG: cytochrome d ubiquinol oxidase subunit II [Candidatus Delongbacteria bacterium]
MEITFLQNIWFILVGVLLIGYAILDGFDLGVGILQFFTKKNEDRRVLINSIAPFWDGNEVWLLTGGGALFAAFPHVYATVFSGFYLAIMLLLVGLIFRAVCMEFRGQVESDAWREFWDKAFNFSSFLIALLLGVALGNIYTGIPLGEDMNYTGSFFTLLRPMPLLIGVTGLMMLVMQGALYLNIKTEGELQERAIKWSMASYKLFVVVLILTTAMVPVLTENNFQIFLSRWGAYPVILVILISLLVIPSFVKKGKYFGAFMASSVIIAAMFMVVALTIYPNLVVDSNDKFSMAINEISASEYTLKSMLIIALIGMPIVLAYTAYIYRVFKGKVKLDEHSY